MTEEGEMMLHSTQIRTSRDLRNNFADIQRLLEEHNQVVITNNGKGAAVIINYADYSAYEEYLREKYVLDRLDKALKSLDDPSTKLLSHDEVWSMLENEWGVK